jgi:hypothetical protein
MPTSVSAPDRYASGDRLIDHADTDLSRSPHIQSNEHEDIGAEWGPRTDANLEGAGLPLAPGRRGSTAHPTDPECGRRRGNLRSTVNRRGRSNKTVIGISITIGGRAEAWFGDGPGFGGGQSCNVCMRF